MHLLGCDKGTVISNGVLGLRKRARTYFGGGECYDVYNVFSSNSATVMSEREQARAQIQPSANMGPKLHGASEEGMWALHTVRYTLCSQVTFILEMFHNKQLSENQCLGIKEVNLPD